MLRYKFYREWLQTRFQEVRVAFAAAGYGCSRTAGMVSPRCIFCAVGSLSMIPDVMHFPVSLGERSTKGVALLVLILLGGSFNLLFCQRQGQPCEMNFCMAELLPVGWCADVFNGGQR